MPLVYGLFFSLEESFHLNHEPNMEGMHLDCMMGAPERVFHRCASVLLNDEEIPKDGDIVLERMFNETLIQMGSLGETVLGKIDLAQVRIEITFLSCQRNILIRRAVNLSRARASRLKEKSSCAKPLPVLRRSSIDVLDSRIRPASPPLTFVLGFADRQYHRDEGVQETWRFLGLMSFSDPIQENAVTAIEKCRLAGVKVRIASTGTFC